MTYPFLFLRRVTNRTFKSTYQIIKEISEVWSSMADVDQAALLELLGGKRNANAVAALIQNFDIAESALKSATDSAGSAAAENEKYLDSILGKVAQFNAAFETLSATVIDSDFSKGVVDTGTDILNIITQIVDGLGTLNTLAMGASAALSIGKVNSIFSPLQTNIIQKDDGSGGTTGSFGIGWTNPLTRDKVGADEYNAALEKYLDVVDRAGESSKEAEKAFGQFSDRTAEITMNVSGSTAELMKTSVAQRANAKAIPNTTGALLKFKAATIGARIATTALNMVLSLGLSAAIQAVVSGLDYLIHREERIAEAAEEAKSAISDISTELDTLRSSTDSAEATLEAFGDQVQYVNGRLTSQTLSTEQLDQYSEAVKTIAEQYPELISGYDAEGNAIIDLTGGYGVLQGKIEEAYRTKQLLANIELDENMPDVVEGAITNVKDLHNQLDEVRDSLASIRYTSSFIDDASRTTVSTASNLLYGANAVKTSVSLLGLADEIQEAIATEGGKWFEANGYLGVKIHKGLFSDEAYDISQIYSDDSEGLQLTQEALEQYYEYLNFDSYAQKAEQEASKLEAQIKAVWGETNQNLLKYFSTDESFTEVNTAFGGLLSNIIGNADWSTLIGENASWEDIKDYVSTNLVDVFSNLDSGVRADVQSLLSGDIASLSVGAYGQVMTRVNNALLAATNGNAEQTAQIMDALEGSMRYTQERIDEIQDKVLGEDRSGNTDTIDALKVKCESLVKVFGDDTDAVDKTKTQFDEFIESLTDGSASIAELEALLQLTTDGSLGACSSFDELKKRYDDLVESFSNTRPYNDIVESFGAVKEISDEAYKAYVQLHGAISQTEYDSWDLNEYRNQSIEDYEAFKALHDEGLIGTNQYRQYLNYFNLENSSEAEEFFKNQGDWYAEGAEGINAWLNAVAQLNDKGIASVEWLEDGVNFQFDIDRIEEFAAAMGMTEEQLWNMIRAYRAYCESWESMSPDEVMDEFISSNVMKQYSTDTGEYFEVLYEDIANYTGLSMAEIENLLDKLREASGKDIRLNLGLRGELENAGEDIARIKETLDNAFADLDLEIVPEVKIDEDGVLHVTQGMVEAMRTKMNDADLWNQLIAWSANEKIQLDADLSIDGKKVADEIKKQTEEDGVATVEVRLDNATQEQLDTIKNTLIELGASDTDIEIDSNIVKITGQAKALQNQLESLKRTASNLKININSISYSSSSSGKSFAPTPVMSTASTGLTLIPHNASGTSSADPGYSLLGDEKSADGSPRPELVVSGDSAYIAGVNGPTVEYLNAGDRVYTYAETKKILGGRNNIKRLPAFAGGFSSSSSKFYQIGAGSSWSSVASSTNYVSGSDFESLYKYHQHLLKMEQESQKDYLDWLDKAYKEAYANGEIELDDYYKYQEEVFSLIRELAEDNLNDAEHYIDMLGHYDGNEKQIIAIYRDLMAAIEKEIASARAAGLDDNSEYLQALQDQWWEYADAIEDIQDEISENAKDAVEDLIDLRVKMIKQDLKNEKQALQEKKSALKDFYDEQKKLLQDEYDEEEYLDEQAEKRKKVSNLEMQISRLSNDDSAWAQKKRLELESELSDARKELSDFEKDHALEVAQDQIDEAYELEEKSIDDSIDLIEKKEDDTKAIRDQAIADLQNADRQMYEEMIAWNDRYGSAISSDITEKWEDATKAMSNYYKLNQEYYEGIDISKGIYPEFLEDEGSWSTNPISGDNPANKTTVSKNNTTASTGTAGSVSNIQAQLSYGSQGDDVKKLQTALKNMGYYTDSIDGKFGPNTQAAVKAFQSNEGIAVDGIVGPNTKAKFKARGYASGTSNASAGMHEIWEEGSEYIFTSSNGKRYRMFTGGEKVLNADATNFLYDFANSGSKVLDTIINSLMGGNNLASITPNVYSTVVNMGDIIVQGGSSERTVSEIRRAQREQVDMILKEFGKLRP